MVALFSAGTTSSRVAWPSGLTARRLALSFMLMLMLLMGLSACSSPPKPPKPTSVIGTISAAEQLNPTANKRPSPVVLRIYELKTAAGFGSADFMALYQGDQAAIGADMVSREEMTLRPGETRAYQKILSAETRFIGVMAAYRDLERATWRAVVAVTPAQEQKLTIRAGEAVLSAVVAN